MRLLRSILAMLIGRPSCRECGRAKTPVPISAHTMGWECLVCWEKARNRLRERQR